MRALVVVDYQNDFVNGSLGSAAAASIEGAVCSRMEDYLAAGDGVFVTMDTHDDGYLETREGIMLPVVHCIEGTDGWELHGWVCEIVGRGGCRILRISVRRDCVASYDDKLGEETLDVLAGLQIEVI